jgi:hypothetical protein
MEQPSALVCVVFSRIQAAKPVNKNKNLLNGDDLHPADLHFFIDGLQLCQDGLPRYTSHSHPNHDHAPSHPHSTANPHPAAHQHTHNSAAADHKIATMITIRVRSPSRASLSGQASGTHPFLLGNQNN